MSYYIHKLRCWLCLMSAMWAQAGAQGKHADWQFERTVAQRRRKHAEELARQLVEMRKVRGIGQ